jgi:cytochrome P450
MDAVERAVVPTQLDAAALPSVSLAETIAYNVQVVLPYLLQGVFTRNRFWTGVLARVHPDPLGVGFIARLRRKYGSAFYVRMLTTKSLVVLDVNDIRRVLDHSPEVFADPPSKRRGMEHFQPGAVTISRGDDWRDRRPFNEAVLAYRSPAHPDSARYLALVAAEVRALQHRPGTGRITWPDVQALFEAVMLQVIFGVGARSDRELVDLLRKMMRESNRGARSTSRHFAPFYDRLRSYLRSPEEGSLSAWCAQVPSSARTRVENQIPHWMFAMMETLAINVARALALIVTHPDAEAAVRAELERADINTPAAIASLSFVEACLHEAMRLWPTTPLLVREVVSDADLGGGSVTRGMQILVLNGFNHRDRETLPFADRFTPSRPFDYVVDYQFNHLSHGPQICAGKELLLFLGKAVVAHLLAGGSYQLRRPALDPSRPLPYALDHFSIVLCPR